MSWPHCGFFSWRAKSFSGLMWYGGEIYNGLFSSETCIASSFNQVKKNKDNCENELYLFPLRTFASEIFVIVLWWGHQKMAWLRRCKHFKSAETVRDVKHFAIDARRGFPPAGPRVVMVRKVIRMSTKQICKVTFIKLPTGRLNLGAIVLIWQDLSHPLHRVHSLAIYSKDFIKCFTPR